MSKRALAGFGNSKTSTTAKKRKISVENLKSLQNKKDKQTRHKQRRQTDKKDKPKKINKQKADNASTSISSSQKAKSYPKEINPQTNQEQEASQIKFVAKPPYRNQRGKLVFEGFPDFSPNMTPKEVLQAGSFGGTYFRPIRSSVTGKNYSGVWKELPEDWLHGLQIRSQVDSKIYNEKVNTYNVKCGGSLEMWESSGWIHKQDPYGWFQWYCRFFQGRRTQDDDRQIGRWLRCAGPQGRWRNNLITKCVKSKCGFDNHTISPVVRQTLQHWGYKLTKEDYEMYAKKLKSKGLV